MNTPFSFKNFYCHHNDIIKKRIGLHICYVFEIIKYLGKISIKSHIGYTLLITVDSCNIISFKE